MIKSIGTSGCVIELMRVAGAITKLKENYTPENIERLREYAHFNRTELRDRTKTYGLIDNNAKGAIAEIKTINALKRIENLEGILFNNVHVEFKDEKVQLDHILVGDYGIIIIDTKARSVVDAEFVEKTKAQMNTQFNVMASYMINLGMGFYKRTLKNFVVLYTQQEIPNDPLFLKDVSKIKEHLQENVIEKDNVGRYQDVIHRLTVYPKISLENDLWGILSSKVKL